MKIKDFLLEMDEEWLPNEYGKWIDFDQFDPPFTLSELKQMEKSKIIELSLKNKKFRLTMKARNYK